MGNTPAKEARSGSSSFGTSNPFARDILLNSSEQGALTGLSRKKREKERERQRRKEEHLVNLIVDYTESVDGGYLAPYGNYKYNLTYKTQVVRDLIIERRLAPFYTPMEDFDEKWTDEELLENVKKLHLHAQCTVDDLLDEEEDPDEHKIYQSANAMRRREKKVFKKRLKEKAVQLQDEADDKFRRDKRTQASGIRTFAEIPSDDLLLKLYRGAQECPICFLYYPKNMNLTRCCVQPICTECLVQMKRLEPHVPHDENAGSNSDTPAEGDSETPSDPDDLISEPVKCPFCAVPDFGVIYAPLDFKSGIGGVAPAEYRDSGKTIEEEDENSEVELESPDLSDTKRLIKGQSGQNSQSRLSLPKGDAQHSRSFSSTSRRLSESDTPVHKRRGSLPPNAPGVVTIDTIRPDWEQRLLNARAKLARRSAAATALHASSLIVEGPQQTHSMAGSTLIADRRGSSNMRVLSRQEQAEIEQKMIDEALRLSLLDEEERKLKEKVKEKEKERETEHRKVQSDVRRK
ncbi:DEKNAAC102330 [Brettanomyces naardenensis]|uniref:DEKNAAC102330 n=1 Tax=Brettanomyces naardenensis TaxID=13370 RepID=A0A448YKK2_BRENA|nr:DEKNAAC102330 [Brettanomyces naardenensis]